MSQSSPSSVAKVLQRKCACGQHTIAGEECESCEKGKRALQLKHAGTNSVAFDGVPPIVEHVLQSTGQPLDAKTRNFMEPRFGHDFSKVRVHSDNVAAQSARAVDALAYTVDFHVVLDNQFLPAQSYRREKVLAHELAHVVQQSRMPAQDSVTLLNDSGLESQADNSTRQVMRGHQTTVSSSGAGLMRTPRSLNSSLDPSAMTPAEIADEIDEIISTSKSLPFPRKQLII